VFHISHERQDGGSTCSYVYSFGAPGHGKGVFDDVGGANKNKVHILIKGTKIQTMVYQELTLVI
jgi:hypothetical protein